MEDVDYVIGYEPGHCDRLRLKNILGVEEFDKVANKMFDLKHLVLDPLVGLDPDSTNKAYLPRKKSAMIHMHGGRF